MKPIINYNSTRFYQIRKGQNLVAKQILNIDKKALIVGSKILIKMPIVMGSRYAGKGLIIIKSEKVNEQLTNLRCKIIVNSFTYESLSIILIILAVWNSILLLASTGGLFVLAMNIPFILFSAIGHFSQKVKIGILENYLHDVIFRDLERSTLYS